MPTSNSPDAAKERGCGNPSCVEHGVDKHGPAFDAASGQRAVKIVLGVNKDQFVNSMRRLAKVNDKLARTMSGNLTRRERVVLTLACWREFWLPYRLYIGSGLYRWQWPNILGRPYRGI